MAYSRKRLIEQALLAIRQKRLFFIEDVVNHLPCSRSTFYNKELDKVDSIKQALEEQKVILKVSMRAKWYKSTNATLQIGLYKLIASEDELSRLSNAALKIDHTTKGDKLPAPQIVVSNEEIENFLTDENRRATESG